MARRLTRSEQVERNRERVLAAARTVFLERGYVGASLDAIAEEAGFSKGVMYSQFRSKADLFLALLDQRIAERGAENERITRDATGPEGLIELLRTAERDASTGSRWAELLIEFRIHAARDPAVNRRYADAHARTVAGIASILERLLSGTGEHPDLSPGLMARLVLALGSGIVLERIAEPNALPPDDVAPALLRLFGLAEAPTPSRGSARLRHRS